MAFKAGSVVVDSEMNTSGFKSGAGLMTKGFKVIAMAGVAAGVAVSAAFGASLVKANAWQKEFANVSTLVDTTKVNMQSMAKDLLLLDSRLGTTKELTNGLYQALSAGVEASKGVEFVATSARFAKAALVDTNTAVDVITTAMNSYGKENVSAAHAADLFFTTIKQGKITGEQLSSVIGQSIPIFSSSGIAIEELTAGVGALTKVGVSASESTTQLNAIVNAFLKPSEALTAALKEQGFESGAAMLKSEGLGGALKFLEEQTGGEADKIAELLPNIRAMAGAMALTGKGGEEFTNILGLMQTATGATDEAFEKQRLTWETLSNSIGKVMIVVGNIGLAFVDKIAGGATLAADAITEFLLSTEGMNTFANLAGKVAGGFALLKEFVAPLVDVYFKTFADVVKTIKEEFNDLTNGIGDTNIAMDILNGVVKFGIIAFKVQAAMVKGLIRHFSNVVAVVTESAKTITSFWDLLTNKGSWQDFKDQTGAVGESLEDVGDNFKETFQEVFEEVRTGFSNIKEDSKDQSASMIKNYKDTSNKVKALTKSMWGELTTGQEDFTGDSEESNAAIVADTKTTTATVEKEWLSANDKIKEGFAKAAGEVASIYSTIAGAFGTMLSSITDVSKQEFENLNAEMMNTQAAQTEAMQEEFLLRQAILDESLENGLISKAEYDVQFAALEEANAEKASLLAKKQMDERNALSKKQFDNDKKMKKGQVWMNAASSIMGFWASLAPLGIPGLIAAGVMTGVVTGAAIAQTSKISDQQFVPERAMGGMASGTTRINEKGGEIVSLPDGSQVVPNDISRQIATDAGNITGGNSVEIKNNISGNNIKDENDMVKLAEIVSNMIGAKLQSLGIA